MNHWCGRAILGELDGLISEAEIMNNYQHSLSIRPCVSRFDTSNLKFSDFRSNQWKVLCTG